MEFQMNITSYLDVVKKFLEKGSNYDQETTDPLQKEINKQYELLARSLSSIILSSSWYEENVAKGSSILIVNYLSNIDTYQRALQLANEDNDHKLMNFYYGKIQDLEKAINELI